MGGEIACTEPVVRWQSIYQDQANTFEELVEIAEIMGKFPNISKRCGC